jgi:RNA polymerase sigma-70 factor (ECF subfamily)
MEIEQKLTEKGQRDYRLIRRALDDGDQQAYAQLVDHYRDSLYYTMLKMSNNPYDAEDLTIEAFGKAFKNLRQYTPDYAFSTWLFKIATNNCIDYLRKKKKISGTIQNKENSEQDGITVKLESKYRDPEEHIINKEKILLMREVVEKLKPHYRKLIKMRYFDELSYDEIVQELGLPLGTVKVQLFRARDFLYNILKNSREKI